MAIELKMPALSPTMEKGTLAKWLVAEGDMVKAGDLIAEIETDKATMEVEATDDGRVAGLVVAEGTDDVAVGTVIALLAGEDEAAPDPAAAGMIAGPAMAPMPAAARWPEPVEPEVAPAVSDPLTRLPPSERLNASPLAQRIAQARGIRLDAIVGTGTDGRISRSDLGVVPLTALRPATPAADIPPVDAVIAPPPAGGPVETVKLSAMRRTIARRLTESKQTIPHFYLTARCNIDALLALRVKLNASLVERGIKISVNDMVLKAMALALVEVPDANVQFGGEALHRFGRADIAVAVAIEGGLVTPVIRDAGALSLSAIAQANKVLAAKAREGKLAPEEFEGGIASLSNLGMYGIDEMAPVINPPQALILGIGAGVEQPWKVDGQIGMATIMAATASFDHRAIDGAVAAAFMAAFRRYVEAPLLMVS
ncbi:2-oxo acid dehydrogenase subunit E2 [Sphingobium ummariense]